MGQFFKIIFRLGILAALVYVCFLTFANPRAKDHYERGMEYYQTHDYPAALSCFREVVESYPLSRWSPECKRKITEIENIVGNRLREEKKQEQTEEKKKEELKFGKDFWSEKYGAADKTGGGGGGGGGSRTRTGGGGSG